MQLGDLLIRAKRVTQEDVAMALQRSREKGGRLGENLIAIGAIDEPTLEKYLHRIPPEPGNVQATGIDENELVGLLMKLIYVDRLLTVQGFMQAIKFPYHIVSELVKMAVDRHLLYALGNRNSENPLDMGYAMTEEGKRWTVDALARLRYAGPAPIPIAAFNEQVSLQKLSNEIITQARVNECVGELDLPRKIIDQIGPAMNSGRAVLLYGPPGNGKTTVALRIASVFQDVIYVPYAVEVEGQVIRVFDPSIHKEVTALDSENDSSSFFRSERHDSRWVPCYRPSVITGGELTLEMLDLRYDTAGQYYEAPLHMKALGGTFFIDDFGRQMVSPTNLLNRWIVPLENRVDYLKLHTGKSFSIPFEELVMFSTNLQPDDLMDPAFLRRLPYKIEVGCPSLERYRRIFRTECERYGLELSDATFDAIACKINAEKGLELAAYQPRFIVDQVIASCRFMGYAPRWESQFIDYAIDNLRVRRAGPDNH